MYKKTIERIQPSKEPMPPDVNLPIENFLIENLRGHFGEILPNRERMDFEIVPDDCTSEVESFIAGLQRPK